MTNLNIEIVGLALCHLNKINGDWKYFISKGC